MSQPKPMYAFLPSGLQRTNFLLWLKRTHAWTGFFGALMFVILGFSGFLLNHRSEMKIDTGPDVVTETEIALGDLRFDTRDAFVAWMSAEYGRDKEVLSAKTPQEPERVSFDGREVVPAVVWEARFWGPNAIIEGYYRPAVGLLTLKKRDYTIGGILKEMHKGHGVGITWILLIDAVAGALLLMSLSGILLWTKLHGPRVAAVAIAGSCLTWFLVALWPSLITASL